MLNEDSDGDLLVSFGRHHFLFSPACCTHVTSDTPVDALKLEANRAVSSAPKTEGSVGKATGIAGTCGPIDGLIAFRFTWLTDWLMCVCVCVCV